MKLRSDKRVGRTSARAVYISPSRHFMNWKLVVLERDFSEKIGVSEFHIKICTLPDPFCRRFSAQK
jgi:hypothetical protein